MYISIETLDINYLLSLSPSLTKSKVYEIISVDKEELIKLNSQTKEELKEKISILFEQEVPTASEDLKQEYLNSLSKEWDKIQYFKDNIFIFNIILIEDENITYDELFIGNSIMFYNYFLQDRKKVCIWGDGSKKNIFELNYMYPLFLTNYDTNKIVKPVKPVNTLPEY